MRQPEERVHWTAAMTTTTRQRRSRFGLFPGKPRPRLYDRIVEVVRVRHDSRRSEDFFLAVCVVLVVLMSMEKKPPNSPQYGTVEIILLPALVAGLFVAMLELPNMQRMVTLTDHDISSTGTFMVFGGPFHLLTGMVQWNRRNSYQRLHRDKNRAEAYWKVRAYVDGK